MPPVSSSQQQQPPAFNFQEFKRLPTAEDKIYYCSDHLGQALGCGVDRCAWRFQVSGKELALKVAKSKVGTKQVKREVTVFNKCVKGSPYFAQVVLYDKENYTWVVMELAKPVKSLDQFKKLTGGIKYRDWLDFLDGMTQNNFLAKYSPNNRWLQGFLAVMKKCSHLHPDDYYRHNLGVVDGNRLVVLDYGGV